MPLRKHFRMSAACSCTMDRLMRSFSLWLIAVYLFNCIFNQIRTAIGMAAVIRLFEISFREFSDLAAQERMNGLTREFDSRLYGKMNAVHKYIYHIRAILSKANTWYAIRIFRAAWNSTGIDMHMTLGHVCSTMFTHYILIVSSVSLRWSFECYQSFTFFLPFYFQLQSEWSSWTTEMGECSMCTGSILLSKFRRNRWETGTSN